MASPLCTVKLPSAYRFQVQLWLENAEKDGFGSGRIRLLELIHELGSLNRAAKLLGMSYRGAWGKVKKAEQIMGVELVEAVGAKRDGYRLTAEGHSLVATYEQLFAEVEAFAIERAHELFNKSE